GIYNAGTLTLSNSTVTGNRADCPVLSCGDPPLPLAGGGIFNGNDTGTAVLTVSNSTVSSNWIPGRGLGGGIANGYEESEGYSPGGIVTISNSTVSNNDVGGTFRASGGGICGSRLVRQGMRAVGTATTRRCGPVLPASDPTCP